MLWEPHVEGRNAHATLYEIYFNDGFLAYVYIGSIPFFITIYHAFKVFGYAGQNRLVSHESIKALKIIKYCALVLFAFVIGGSIYILLGESDDRAGGVFMCALASLGAIIIATTAFIFEQFIFKFVIED